MRARLAGVAAAVVVVVVAGCSTFRTRSLVDQFNGGVLGADPGDPRRAPLSRQREIVDAIVADGFKDAYFTQGERDRPTMCSIAYWLEKDAEERTLLARSNEYAACSVSDAATKEQAVARVTQADLQSATTGSTGWCDGGDVPPPACDAAGRLSDVRWADWVRFTVARRRTAQRIGDLVTEGLLRPSDVDRWMPDALRRAARYLRMRRWRRSTETPVRALVVKGGAGTGIYSAGAVWATMQIVNEGDRFLEMAGVPHDHRFRLMSGTSTGALVSSAVDIFNTATTYEKRWAVLHELGRWFTCYGSANLYCVQDAPATAMLEHQRGLLRFDGIRRLLEQHLGCADATNDSELVLNTVDFRRGRLFDFSDQNRLELRGTRDVRNAVLASAELPFIVEPERHMPVDDDAGAGDHAYLDGGIRSELPVLPVARRGAERVLVVSSASSLTPEIGELGNGLAIATRYIDVTLGGITESEPAHAQRLVESIRQEEIRRCDATVKMPAFCRARWKEACKAPPPGAPPPAPPPEDDLSALWRMESLFRDEERVPGIPGYAFSTDEFTRIFRAGAEAVRQRCKAIAELLFGDDAPSVLAVRGICAPPVPESFCPGTTLGPKRIPSCPEKDDPGEQVPCAE